MLSVGVKYIIRLLEYIQRISLYGRGFGFAQHLNYVLHKLLIAQEFYFFQIVKLV